MAGTIARPKPEVAAFPQVRRTNHAFHSVADLLNAPGAFGARDIDGHSGTMSTAAFDGDSRPRVDATPLSTRDVVANRITATVAVLNRAMVELALVVESGARRAMFPVHEPEHALLESLLAERDAHLAMSKDLLIACGDSTFLEWMASAPPSAETAAAATVWADIVVTSVRPKSYLPTRLEESGFVLADALVAADQSVRETRLMYLGFRLIDRHAPEALDTVLSAQEVVNGLIHAGTLVREELDQYREPGKPLSAAAILLDYALDGTADTMRYELGDVAAILHGATNAPDTLRR